MGKFFLEVIEDLRQRGHNTSNSGPLSYQEPKGRFRLAAAGSWHQAFLQDLPNTTMTFLEMQRQCILTIHLREVPPQTPAAQAAKEGERSFHDIKGWNTWKETLPASGSILRERTSYFRDEILNTLSTAVELVHTVIGSVHVTLVLRTDSEEANIIDGVAAQLSQAFGAAQPQMPQAGIQGGIPQSGIPQGRPPQGGIPQSGLQQGGIPQSGFQQGGIQGGIPQGNIQGGIPQSGIPQGGIQQGGIPQAGFPQAGIQQGIPQGGIPQQGVPQSNIPQGGIPQAGLQGGLPQGGFQQGGIPQAGFQQGGIPQSGIPQGNIQGGIPQSGIPQGGIQQGIPHAGAVSSAHQQGIPQGGFPQQTAQYQAQTVPQVADAELPVLSFAPLAVSFSIPADCQVVSMTRDSAVLASSFYQGLLVASVGVQAEPAVVVALLARTLQERGYTVSGQGALQPEASQAHRSLFTAVQGRDAYGAQLSGFIRVIIGAGENFLALAVLGSLSQHVEGLLRSVRLGRILPSTIAAQELVGTWSATQAQAAGERASYTFFADGRYRYQRGQAQSTSMLGAMWGALQGGADEGRYLVSHGALVLSSAQGSRAVSLRRDGQQTTINNEVFVRTA